MNHHGQFRVNSGMDIMFQITIDWKIQRSCISLINKISNLPIVTRANYVFRYLVIYLSNSKLGNEGEILGRERNF